MMITTLTLIFHPPPPPRRGGDRQGSEYRWGQGQCFSLTNGLAWEETWDPCSGRPTARAHEEWGYCQVAHPTRSSSASSSTSTISSISTLSGGYERSPPSRPDGSDRNTGSSHLAGHRLCRLHLRCEHSSHFLPWIEHVFSASCIFHLTTSSISLHPSSQICTTETPVGATQTGCDLKRDFASHCPHKRRTSTHSPQGGNIAEQLAQSAHHPLTY